MTSNLEFYQRRRRQNIWLLYAAAILIGFGLGNAWRFWSPEDPILAVGLVLSTVLPMYVWIRAASNMRHWQDQIRIELGVVE